MKDVWFFVIVILISGSLSGQSQLPHKSVSKSLESLDSLELRLLGAQKAKFEYQPGSIDVATGISTFLFPPIGLTITTVICSRDVKEKKLYFSESENIFYMEGLKEECLSIKRKKAWRGVGFGFGALLGLSLAAAVL